MPAAPRTAASAPAQLEEFLARGELGRVVDDQVVVTERARMLLDALRPEYRGDARRRAHRIA